LAEDYSEGSLDDELSAGVQLHLGECPECRTLLAHVQAEEELFRDYGRKVASELEVSPGMWPNIRATLERARVIRPEPHGASRSGRRVRWWVLSAGWRPWTRQLAFSALLVVISIACTLLVVSYQGRHDQSAEIQPVGELPAAGTGTTETASPSARSSDSGEDTRSLEAAVRALQRAERDYIEAIQVLSDIVEKRKPTLDARIVIELEKSLRAVDVSIEAARKAYYSHPSDPYLAQYLLTAYRQKVELLQELAS
jgi:anti-sigma factor RsiW